MIADLRLVDEHEEHHHGDCQAPLPCLKRWKRPYARARAVARAEIAIGDVRDVADDTYVRNAVDEDGEDRDRQRHALRWQIIDIALGPEPQLPAKHHQSEDDRLDREDRDEDLEKARYVARQISRRRTKRGYGAEEVQSAARGLSRPKGSSGEDAEGNAQADHSELPVKKSEVGFRLESSVLERENFAIVASKMASMRQAGKAVPSASEF